MLCGPHECPPLPQGGYFFLSAMCLDAADRQTCAAPTNVHYHYNSFPPAFNSAYLANFYNYLARAVPVSIFLRVHLREASQQVLSHGASRAFFAVTLPIIAPNIQMLYRYHAFNVHFCSCTAIQTGYPVSQFSNPSAQRTPPLFFLLSSLFFISSRLAIFRAARGRNGGDGTTPHSSLLTPHSSLLTSHSSFLTPHFLLLILLTGKKRNAERDLIPHSAFRINP